MTTVAAVRSAPATTANGRKSKSGTAVDKALAGNRKLSLSTRLRKTDEEQAGMVRRMIRSTGRRAAESDPELALPMIEALHQAVAEAELIAVTAWRRAGFSWAEIGAGLHITKQAAMKRWAADVAAALAADGAA